MKGILAILMAGIMMAAMIAPAMGGDVGTEAIVDNAPPIVTDKCESPNPVTPDAEGPVTVMKCAIVCDDNGKDTISSVTAVTAYPDTTEKDAETMHIANASERLACCLSPLPPVDDPVCEVYVGYFTILPCDPAGNYDVAVTVTDDKGATHTLHNILVVEALVAVNITDMGYGNVNASSIDNPGKHVATNNGNVMIGLDTITSGDMIDGGNTIPAAGITCDNPLVTIAPSTPPACAGTSEDVTFKLDVPAVPAGTYIGTTTFTPHEVTA